MEGENLIIRSGDAEREWPRPTVRRRALPSPVSLRVRMGAVVDLHHVFDGELRVALRGREALMAEHLLDRAQVGAFLQHVSAEGMAQRVRMHIGRESARYGDLLHNAAQ